MRLLAILALSLYLFLLSLAVVVVNAQSRGPIPAGVFQSVRAFWKTRPERIAAFDVSWCEARFDPGARNGQYLGIFQMGSWERATYGFGPGAWGQAQGAYRYYVATGRTWGPWTCKPT
jgi:hypothetical protein